MSFVNFTGNITTVKCCIWSLIIKYIMRLVLFNKLDTKMLKMTIGHL